MSSPQPYPDGATHLFDRLGYLNLLLRRAVAVARVRRGGVDAEGLPGTLISETELDRLVATPATDTGPAVDRAEEAIEAKRIAILERVAASRIAGVALPMVSLAERFGLCEAEEDLLLVALGPEIETRYEMIFGYLQDDVTRKRPSVELALGLLCRDPREKLIARRFFDDDAPLLRERLITLGEEAYDRQPTVLRRFLKIEPATLRFLLDAAPGGDEGVVVLAPDEPELVTSAASGAALDRLATMLHGVGIAGSIVHLEGDADSPLESAAAALGGALGRTLLIADIDRLAATPDRAAALARDARLWNALPVLRYAAAAPAGEDGRAPARPDHAPVWAALRRHALGAVVLAPTDVIGALPADFRLWRVAIAPVGFAERRELWHAASGGTLPAADIERLADVFQFDAARIRQAVYLARADAKLAGTGDAAPDLAALIGAARALATPNLAQFAVPIRSELGWDDIILPEERKNQLKSLVARVANRAIVQRDWGLVSGPTRGRGVAAMLNGPPGTGKTMAAGIIAARLALDLFQIDLSTVMSKYIGETEKQLAQIFAEAERGECVLFFDECDAVFGKRTEVSDARDYYANSQVNYLLQRLEQYDGIVLLATNFPKNVDDAFLRRLSDSVDFPMPDERSRTSIWERQFPEGVPIRDLDYAALGRNYVLSGGGIANAAHHAAYRAAELGGAQGVVTMDLVIEGVRREFQKQGKLVVAHDAALTSRGGR